MTLSHGIIPFPTPLLNMGAVAGEGKAQFFLFFAVSTETINKGGKKNKRPNAAC